MTDYYDLILGLIPLTVGGVAGLLVFGGVGYSLAIPIGAMCSLPLIGHAMFVNAPVTPVPAVAEREPQSNAQSGLQSAD